VVTCVQVTTIFIWWHSTNVISCVLTWPTSQETRDTQNMTTFKSTHSEKNTDFYHLERIVEMQVREIWKCWLRSSYTDFGKRIWGGKERGPKGQGWRPKWSRAGVRFLGGQQVPWGGSKSPPHQLGVCGSAVSSPVGSGGRQTVFPHFKQSECLSVAFCLSCNTPLVSDKIRLWCS